MTMTERAAYYTKIPFIKDVIRRYANERWLWTAMCGQTMLSVSLAMPLVLPLLWTCLQFVSLIVNLVCCELYVLWMSQSSKMPIWSSDACCNCESASWPVWCCVFWNWCTISWLEYVLVFLVVNFVRLHVYDCKLQLKTISLYCLFDFLFVYFCECCVECHY